MSAAIEMRGLCPLIQVFNMRRSLGFYRDLLGFTVVADSGGGDDASWVWLRRGAINLMLNDQYEPGYVPEVPPDERTLWHKDTCLYFDCPDPDAAYGYLRSKGVELEAPNTAPYGMRQLYLSDPDGYGICFQCPAQ